jgi:RNA polymerase primary sigma factor
VSEKLRRRATEEELMDELARRVRQTHGDDDLSRQIERAERAATRAQDAFVRANVGLVFSLAHRYLGRGLALSDLVQEGNLGVLRAVEKFDPDRGFRFSTYASWWIRQSMIRALCNQARTIRVPVHAIELNRKLNQARRVCEQESGSPPSPSELAARTGLQEHQVNSFADLSHEPMSLDAPVGASTKLLLGEVIADDGPDPLEITVAAERAARLTRLLSHLSVRERTILRQRFGLDGRGSRTLREIGDEAGVSRERIRQLEAEALSKLKVLARLTGTDDSGASGHGRA